MKWTFCPKKKTKKKGKNAKNSKTQLDEKTCLIKDDSGEGL